MIPPILTTEQRELSDEEQRQRAKAFRDSITAGNIAFARAKAVIQETESIFGDARSVKKQKSLLTPLQCERYAESLAAVGDYKTAHIFDNSRNYDKIWKAIWIDDTATCKCESVKQMQQSGQVMEYSPLFTRKKIYSVKHGTEASLWQCNKCGFLNAR